MTHNNILITLLALILTITISATVPDASPSGSATIPNATPSGPTIHFTDRQGLSSNSIGNAVQDSKGYIWFATWNGLNRFDGYEFHWIKTHPGDGTSLTNDRIRDILLSPDGNIWCHSDEGIFRFDLHDYTFHAIPADKRTYIQKVMGQNWQGMHDIEGNFWYTNGHDGIFKTTATHHPAYIIPGTENLHARASLIDNQNRLWIATKEDQSVRIYTYRTNPATQKAVFTLLGYLTPSGTISPTPQSFHQTVYSLFQAPNGDIWIGCKPGKLIRIFTTGNVQEEVISSDVVYDIQRDKYGRLWLACFKDGIKCCPNPTAQHPTISKSLGGNRVRKLLITPSQQLIAATSEGLITATIPSTTVPSTLPKGLKFTSIHRRGNDPTSLASDATLDITQTSDGTIYVATESSGIDAFHLPLNDKTKFTHISTATSSLPSDFGISITSQSDSTLMFLSPSSMALIPIPQRSGSITTGSAEGESMSSSVESYNTYFFGDSCQFSEAKPMQLKDGTWIFLTTHGALAVAEKKSMLSRGYIPPLHFTYIEVNGSEPDCQRVLSDTITLSPDERNITLAYAAIDHTNNTDILYRTSLDGSTWTKASHNRQLTLFDLTPTTHILRVQSTDCYGRWVNNIHTLTIIAQPHWYETWWSTLLLWLLIFAIAAGLTYTYLYIKALNRQRRELLDKLMAATAAPTTHTDSATSTDVSTSQCAAAPSLQGKGQLAGVGRGWAGGEAPDASITSSPFLSKIRDFIEKNISNSDVTIDDMAAYTATSRSTLNRRLRSMIGITAAQLLIDARIQRAAQLLEQARNLPASDFSVSDIAYKCGYSDPRYFSKCFKQKYGVTPTEYKDAQSLKE